MYITLDGREYKVRVKFKNLTRSFEIAEGSNSGESVSGRLIRDILGTRYTYQLAVEPEPKHRTDYDEFYDAISEPVESHHVIMPYGQDTLEFDAAVYSGEDTYGGEMGGYDYWSGLTVTFQPLEPQRTAEEDSDE